MVRLMDMGQKIKTLREKHGMTLEQLGDKVGVGKSTVRKWENGIITNMKRDKIKKVADALNVSPAYLMGWDENNQQEEVPYYLNDDAREIAEFLFKNPEYKVLFDASRKVKKEDIQFVKEMLDRMRGGDNIE